MKIEITIDQFNAIARLGDFADWYINEHEGHDHSHEQWLNDKQDVLAGVKALEEINHFLQFS